MKLVLKRIVLSIALFIAVVFISGYLLIKTFDKLNEDVVHRTALLIGDSINDILQNASIKGLEKLSFAEKRNLRQVMNALTSDEGNIIHVLLIDDKMRIVLSSDKSVEGHEYTTPQELANLQGDQPKVINRTWEGGFRIVDVILPLENEEGFIYGYLRLVLSQKELFNFFSDISLILIPLAIVIGLLIIFSLYFISTTYRRPIESIEEMAQNLQAGDFNYRIDYKKKDEFTDTFTSINKSLEKVSVLNESYKKAEKRINVLMQVVDESIILLDHKGEILSYNEASVELFKCPVEIMFEKHFKQIRSLNKELTSIIDTSYKNNSNFTGREITLWLPSGEDTLVRVSTYVFKEEHKLSGVLLTIKDQKLINELQRNLQRSMKFGVITNLASSISHELKNPLSSMAIHGEILNVRLSQMQIENKDVIDKSLSVIQNEIKRLNRIINQFFTLARIKKTDLNQINLNSVLEDVLDLIHQQAIERNIKVKQELDKNIEKVYGDADQLKQVFLNIILNAFQAIHHDGTTTIRTKQNSQRVVVEIEDDGAGMSPEVQQRLFELYFTTKKDGGGIGMAICKNIVEAHEGNLNFNSIQGKGTTFVIDFPKKDQSGIFKAAPRLKQLDTEPA